MRWEKTVKNISFKTILFSALLALGFNALASETNGVNNHLNPEILSELESALVARGSNYEPRTEHLREDGSPIYLNRLIKEDSPYLLQHAHNPVNWYPWGEEAFATAKREQKPIFLSIGYATCHWCHVMERESFENEAIAKIVNEHFIAIKVDREQRPDVDATFMTAVQLISGGGGWPMSSFLTSEGKPFFGGTYYPPAQFTHLLRQVNKVWHEDQTNLLQQAEQLSAAVAQQNDVRGEAREVGEREVKRAVDLLVQNQDYQQGGFSGAPKFPQEPILYLLLEQAQRNADGMALGAAHFALQKMAAGGIYDQIAGGFHRYSVDANWLVPHFEKMLYNQANLTRNYLQAFLLTGDNAHANTVRHTLDYVLREMTSPNGGFYSATDADSEGEEGAFFIWTPAQLEAALGADDAKRAIAVWGVSDAGNFEGRNILHLPQATEAAATSLGMTHGELKTEINRWREKLLSVRSQREHPIRDDKVITAWNGMMITALTEAGDRLNEPRYLDAAVTAANFVWEVNHRDDGLLWRTYFDGNASIEATLSDYAFYAEAMLALFDVTRETVWLDRARILTEKMIGNFWDVKNGAFFMGGAVAGGAELPSRPKDITDGALPAGNAVALRILSKLWHRTGEDKYQTRASELLAALSGNIAAQPAGFSYTLTAASELLWGESGARQYAARGKLRVDAKRVGSDKFQVSIDVAPGWHINANTPLQDNLIGTALSSANDEPLKNLQYPEAVSRQLGFQRAELALYEGTTTITGTLPATTDGRSIVPLALRIQACSDVVCLAPETLSLNVSTASES